MAGHGPAPKQERRRANGPERGEWEAAEGIGWQHGRTPTAPTGLKPESRAAWKAWMGSWFAAHWIAEDLPALRQLVKLYDQVERGEFQRMGELRLQMDTYAITPKGQQDRRWKQPEPSGNAEPKARKYGHLKAIAGP